MRITKIKIQNYRALRDIEIPLQDLSILIGQNDAGKTSVLNAIDEVFNPKKLKGTEWHGRQYKNVPIEIELSLEDVVPNEHVPTVDNKVTIKYELESPDKLPSYFYKKDGKDVPIKSTDAKKFFSDKQFIFIPVKRDIDDHFSASKSNGMLRKVLNVVMRQALEDDAGMKKSIKDVAHFLQKAIKGPEEEIQGFLREQIGNDVQFSFGEFNVDPVNGMSFTNSVSDSNSPDIHLDSRGAGTQNNAIIALFRYLAVSDVAKNFIFGIEEPENSLHPKAQRQLLSAIQDISELTQVIVTTHSPVFIDRSHYTSNILMTMSSKGDTAAKIFQDLGDEDVRGELGIRVSDALLSGGGNCALLVEGNTEKESFPVFMKMMKIDEINLGISIIPVGGKDAKKYRPLVRLLNRYDIPCVVVLDKDAQKDAEDLKRGMKSDMPNLKEVFLWEKGAIEDYYPPEIVMEAIEKEEKIKIEPADKESVQKSSKKGIDRYKEIRDSYKLGNENWLKKVIGDTGTKLMHAQQKDVHEDIKKVLMRVEEIAKGGNG